MLGFAVMGQFEGTMNERFIFFVNNQVFGTGCSPFTAY